MNCLQQIIAKVSSDLRRVCELFGLEEQDLLMNRPGDIPTTDSIAMLSPEMALMQDI